MLRCASDGRWAEHLAASAGRDSLDVAPVEVPVWVCQLSGVVCSLLAVASSHVLLTQAVLEDSTACVT